jgi:iron uptake system component EfeO
MSGTAVAAMFISACGSSDKPTARPSDDPGPPVVAVTLTDAGCVPDNFNLHPGDVEFRVTNSGTTKTKEMEVQDPDGHVRGDVEGVQPGKTRSFTMKLNVGTYRVRCPEDAPAGGTITVK